MMNENENVGVVGDETAEVTPDQGGVSSGHPGPTDHSGKQGKVPDDWDAAHNEDGSRVPDDWDAAYNEDGSSVGVPSPAPPNK